MATVEVVLLTVAVLICQPLDASEAEERVASLEADLEALQEQNGEETLKQGHPLSHGSNMVLWLLP